MALDFAALRIDRPAVEAVRNGSIRLMRCSWLLRYCLVHGMMAGLPRCQELPEEAFFPPEEAAALLENGSRSVFVLSYGWQTASQPDPQGVTLRTLVRYLSNTVDVGTCAIFMDFCCIPQHPRSEEEERRFQEGLKNMTSLYASITGTAVLQIKHIPERPVEYNGRLKLFALAPQWLEGGALRTDLGRFGTVVGCMVDGQLREAHVQFATHVAAERAYDELSIANRPAALEYNNRAYDHRGW